jgi:hypothetical protein
LNISTLFPLSQGLAKRWTGTLSTDGIVAHWHLQRPKKASTPSSNPVRSVPFRNGHFGTLGYPVQFVGENFNVIAIDPGHATLISAVRLHRILPSAVPVSVDDETRKQRRRRLLRDKLAELQRSTFAISNKEWQSNTGLLNRARVDAVELRGALNTKLSNSFL